MVRSMRALRLALDSRRVRRTWAWATVFPAMRVTAKRTTASRCIFFLKPDINDYSCEQFLALVKISGCIQTGIETLTLIRTFAASHRGARTAKERKRWRKRVVEAQVKSFWALFWAF